MHKVGFYYQIWFTNQRSIFENLKQLRILYPEEKIYLVIAGLQSKNKDLYLESFLNKLIHHFNISAINFLFADEIRSMPTLFYRFQDMGINIRDVFNEFNNIWIQKLVDTVDKDIDILVNCSDDWFVIRPFNIDLKKDISCRLEEWSDWMEKDKILKHINKDFDKVPWMQHGHYFNYQKFLKNYTEDNIALINNAITVTYPEDLPIFLDYFHALWNMVVFNTFEDSTHIAEDKEDPFERSKHNPVETFHGYIKYRSLNHSQEMLNLGFKVYNE